MKFKTLLKVINNTTKFSIYYQESDEFKFIFPRFSPYSHPNNKWGHFYWSVRNVTWGFLISIFPAVKCKLPLRDLTFGQNKIIVIVHNSNDPRNCVVYSVILNRDTNRDIASSSDLSSHLNTNKSNLREH